MSYCQSQTAVKHVGDRQLIVSLRCRSWTCPDCAPDRKRALMAQGIGGAPTKFLTLTIRRTDKATPEEAAKKLSHAWRLLRLRIMRKYRWKRLPFLAVFENHKSGYPHLHICLRSRYIDIFFIRDVMTELLDSPRQWIEIVKDQSRVAGYCAKYCTKCAVKFGTAKRYWQSRDWDIRDTNDKDIPKKKQGGWDVWPLSLSGWRDYATQLGLNWKQRSAYILEIDSRCPT